MKTAEITQPVGRDAVNVEWLKAVLSEADYAVTDGPEGTVLAKGSGKPNVVAKIVPGMSIILFRTIWGMKKGGFGAKKDILKEVNEANRESFIETFYTDTDGDLWTSSYIVLTEDITPNDVINFLQRETVAFLAVAQKSGLWEHMK